MNANYAVLNVAKYHTFYQLSATMKHNHRMIPLEHIDTSRSIQNRTLVDPGMDYTLAWKHRLQQAELECNHPIPVRKNAVLALQLLLSYSHDAEVDINQWAEKNVEWLKERFGEDNVLACVLHMDESTPHIHATIIPITKDYRLSAKSLIDGPFELKQLQTDYANAMAGFSLLRGEEKRKRPKHKTLYDFYHSLNEIESHPAPQIEADETYDQYVKRMKEYIRQMTLAIHYLKTQISRENEIFEARVNEALEPYRNAILLQQRLEESFDEEEAVTDRLQDYLRLEKSIPRDELQKVIDFLKQKYPLEENLEFLHPEKEEL